MTDQPTHHYSRTRDESGERVHIDGRPVPRFEIVHKPRRESDPYDSMVTPTDEPNPQPWHVRQIHGNGEPGWTTETYADEASAENAIVALAHMFDPDAELVDVWGSVRGHALLTSRGSIPILRVEVQA